MVTKSLGKSKNTSRVFSSFSKELTILSIKVNVAIPDKCLSLKQIDKFKEFHSFLENRLRVMIIIS